jgi:methyl-accepting chemotaxis protein
MADRVEEYQDEHNLTSAEAVRRLVAAGLEQQDEPTREEIAADLRRVNESVDDVADDLDDLRADLDDHSDHPELSTARMNQTVQRYGGILMLLLVAFLAAAEVGLL